MKIKWINSRELGIILLVLLIGCMVEKEIKEVKVPEVIEAEKPSDELRIISCRFTIRDGECQSFKNGTENCNQGTCSEGDCLAGKGRK